MDFSKLAALWISCLCLLGECRADKLGQVSAEPQQLDNGTSAAHLLALDRNVKIIRSQGFSK